MFSYSANFGYGTPFCPKDGKKFKYESLQQTGGTPKILCGFTIHIIQ